VNTVVDNQRQYWNGFYSKHRGVDFPSPFAEFCLNNFIEPRSRILELGSGNGRDSFYFSHNRHDVIAVDRSAAGIAQSRRHAEEMINPGTTTFIEGDFTTLDTSSFEEIDTVYSRFTMHSIDYEAEQRVIDFAWNILSPGGRFLIEARTINDPLYGEGDEIGLHEFVIDHYRRHIDAEVLLTKVRERGFHLKFFRESNGLAVFKDEDPVVVRLALMRP
jgi:tellurite methyltransferase